MSDYSETVATSADGRHRVILIPDEYPDQPYDDSGPHVFHVESGYYGDCPDNHETRTAPHEPDGPQLDLRTPEGRQEVAALLAADPYDGPGEAFAAAVEWDQLTLEAETDRLP